MAKPYPQAEPIAEIPSLDGARGSTAGSRKRGGAGRSGEGNDWVTEIPSVSIPIYSSLELVLNLPAPHFHFLISLSSFHRHREFSPKMTRQNGERSTKRARYEDEVTKNGELTSAAEAFFEALGKSSPGCVNILSNGNSS